MRELGVVIVEDDPLFAVEVEMMLVDLGYSKVFVFDNAVDAKKHINRTKPDLLLLDVFLKGKMSGIDFAEEISPLSIPCIFFTGYQDKDLYERAKKLKPYAYLIKPFDIITLQSAVESVLLPLVEANKDLKNKTFQRDGIFIKQSNQYLKLYFHDLLWIKSEGNYCIIKTTAKRFVLKTSLVNFYKKIPSSMFLQVHRAYLVLFEAINNVDFNNNKILIGNDEIPIGGKYKSELLKRVKENQ